MVVNILAVALTTFLTSLLNESLTGEASNKIQLGAAPRFTIPVFRRSDPGRIFKDVYIFAPFILVFALIAWYLLYKTRYGLSLRACGRESLQRGCCRGSVSNIRFTAVMICGALSGLAGIFLPIPLRPTFSKHLYGYGYLSIAALIFGNWKFSPPWRSAVFRAGKIRRLPSSPSPSVSPAKSPICSSPCPTSHPPPAHLLLQTQPSPPCCR